MDDETPKQGNGDDDDEEDIEAEIKREVADMRKPTKRALFHPIKIDSPCGMTVLSPVTAARKRGFG